MKKVLFFIAALVANMFVGALVAPALGITALSGGIGTGVVSLIAGQFAPQGVAMAGLLTEVWTGEMVKAFRTSMESIGWLNKIRSYDQYAENDVIHFVNIGGDPTVLVNNTTYPLEIETLADADKAISLDKYQTKPTAVTDDEIYALSYDKMASVIDRHKDAMSEKKYQKAIHALAPAGHTSATPVILTTGDNDEGGTRKMITRQNIIALKKAFDGIKVPLAGRILVLCPDHINDLLLADQKFADQYYNYTSGKIANLYGFEVYEYQDNPYYGFAAKTKLAFGGTVTADHRQASVAFFAPRMMKATGSTKAYLSEAKNDPKTQQNLVNYRHYFIALPLKNEAIGAIVSDNAASGS
jgi:hypothetical protein